MKPVNTFGWQNAELMDVKVVCTYSYHWVLKGLKQDSGNVHAILHFK
jgi:hypothetical protein